jgi:hypothetical protein
LLQRTGNDLTRELQLIGFNSDNTNRVAVQRGVSQSWGAAAQDKEKWRKLAAGLPLALVETKPISEQARTERTQSEHAQSAPGPAATMTRGTGHLVANIAA